MVRGPDGSRVTIGDDVARAVGGTRLYAPDDPLPDSPPGTPSEPPAPPAIEVPRAAQQGAAGAGVAAAHGHRDIVLGAWGCGVFRNSPDVVAAAFRTALPQVPHFDRVVFATLDPAGVGPSYRAFVRAFTREG